MKPGLDLKQFKKGVSDKDSTTFMHPDGHKIVVKHSSLSKQMKDKLSAIPESFSSGGEAGGGGPTDEEIAAEDAKADALYDRRPVMDIGDKSQNTVDAQAANIGVPSEQAIPSSNGAISSQQPAIASITPPVNPVVPGSDPYGYGQEAGAINSDIGKFSKAQDMAAQSEGARGARESAAARDYQVAQDMMLGRVNHYFAQSEQDAHDTINDMKKNFINSNHYQESRTSGQRVSAAIGMILGGIGGGLLHQANPAVGMLNEQIDRDIKAQMANQDTRKTLLGAYQQQFHNFGDALNMTKAIMANSYAAKLEDAAAQARGPEAQARGMAAAAQLRLPYEPILQQLHQKKAITQGLQDPNIDPGAKIRMLQMTGQMSPEQGKQAFEELTKAQMAVKERNNLLAMWDQAAKDNTLANRTLHGGYEPGSLKALRLNVAPLMKDEAGRPSEILMNAAEGTFPGAGDSGYKQSEARAGFKTLLDKSAEHPFLNSFGISLDNQQKYTPSGQPKIKLGPAVPNKK